MFACFSLWTTVTINRVMVSDVGLERFVTQLLTLFVCAVVSFLGCQSSLDHESCPQLHVGSDLFSQQSA